MHFRSSMLLSLPLLALGLNGCGGAQTNSAPETKQATVRQEPAPLCEKHELKGEAVFFGVREKAFMLPLPYSTAWVHKCDEKALFVMEKDDPATGTTVAGALLMAEGRPTLKQARDGIMSSDPRPKNKAGIELVVGEMKEFDLGPSRIGLWKLHSKASPTEFLRYYLLRVIPVAGGSILVTFMTDLHDTAKATDTDAQIRHVQALATFIAMANVDRAAYEKLFKAQ